MKKTIRRKIELRPPELDDINAYMALLASGYTKMHLADICGITKQAVTRWETIPVKYVRVLSEHTGIPKKKLRPSDFS